MSNMETNKKYEKIYNDALNQTPPKWDGCTFERDSKGNVKPATPVGYDNEQLQFDALNEVILEAFTKSKDYVCWSNGGYARKTDDILETLEGTILMKYDPVMILGNFGEPVGHMMFTGECVEEDGYLRPKFIYITSDDEVRKYRPKIYIRK